MLILYGARGWKMYCGLQSTCNPAVWNLCESRVGPFLPLVSTLETRNDRGGEGGTICESCTHGVLDVSFTVQAETATMHTRYRGIRYVRNLAKFTGVFLKIS